MKSHAKYSELLAAIAEELRAMCEAKEIVLVAIDGAGGAGKSTLARKLARKIDAVVIEFDDFYRVMDESDRLNLDAASGCMQYFDWQRLRGQVLAPLSTGRRAIYDRYDWGSNRLSEQVTVQPTGTILVEGVYSYRPELRDYYDFSILVETPRPERMSRLHARKQNEDEWIQRWDAAEQWYFANLFPPAGVDIVLSGLEEG